MEFESAELDNPVSRELDATQSMFDALDLPEGSNRRRLTPADAALYVAFDTMGSFEHNPTYQGSSPSPNMPALFEVDDIAEAIEHGDTFEGMFSPDGTLIATMWLKPMGTNVLEIANLVVDPAYRNRKIAARYLLPAADEIAKLRGMEYCTLHVDPLNGPGIKTYMQHGYRMVGYEQHSSEGLNNWLIGVRQVKGWTADQVPTQPQHKVRAGDADILSTLIQDQGLTGVGFERGDQNDQNRIVVAKVAGSMALRQIVNAG